MFLELAEWAAAHLMNRGRIQIASMFGVEEGSPEHTELCKALLPTFLSTAAVHFKEGVRWVDEDKLEWVVEPNAPPFFPKHHEAEA